MHKTIQRLISTFLPFISLGVIITLIFVLLVMLSYVFLWGIIIGAILWLAVTIKRYFFPPIARKKPTGRIIEHQPDDHDA